MNMLIYVVELLSPSSRHNATVFLVLIYTPVFAVLAIPWFVLKTMFMFGKIQCPSCAAPFAWGPSGLFWVPKTCGHCGFDIGAQ
jgi:hypothetical protein